MDTLSLNYNSCQYRSYRMLPLDAATAGDHAASVICNPPPRRCRNQTASATPRQGMEPGGLVNEARHQRARADYL
jgi:hypothetical protein